jgi:glycosyltransferase involved in cell wall biosynthesis
VSAIPKPRLLVLASTYPRWVGDHEPGFVHELCRRLVDRFDVVVLTPGAPLAKSSEEMDGVLVSRFRYAPKAMETLVSDGGMVANLRRHPWKWLLVPGFLLGMLFATIRQVRRGKFHAVHAHWLIPQGLVAALARVAGNPRPPLLVTVHGGDLYAFRSKPFRWVKKEVARRAAAITVVGTAMQDAVGKLAGGRVPVLVEPMGVAFSAFRPAPEVSRSQAELLFVGRLVEKKGLRYLLDALPAIASAVQDVRLTIVGFGPEEAELRERAR